MEKLRMARRLLLWLLRVRVPLLPRRLLLQEGSLTLLWLATRSTTSRTPERGSVLFDDSDTDSDREQRQRKVAAIIEHQLTHSPKCIGVECV